MPRFLNRSDFNSARARGEVKERCVISTLSSRLSPGLSRTKKRKLKRFLERLVRSVSKQWRQASRAWMLMVKNEFTNSDDPYTAAGKRRVHARFWNRVEKMKADSGE